MKLDEIARLAGVSRTTASYVINGKAKQYRVSDKTVEKVMAVVREHNYHPNALLQACVQDVRVPLAWLSRTWKTPAIRASQITWSVRRASAAISC